MQCATAGAPISRSRSTALVPRRWSDGDTAALVAALAQALATLRAHAATAAERNVSREPAPPPAEAARPALRLLRVDEAKIDALVNLAGELIVAKNGLAHLARKVRDEFERPRPRRRRRPRA